MYFISGDLFYLALFIVILSKISLFSICIIILTLIIFSLLIEYLNIRSEKNIKKIIEEENLQQKLSIPITPIHIKSDLVPTGDVWLELKDGQYHLRAYHSSTIDRERDPETYDLWLKQLIELQTRNGTLPK